MLKNLRTAAVALATAGALVSGAAHAVELTSRATILQAFTLAATQELQFGDIFAPTVAKTLTINPDGSAVPELGLTLGTQVPTTAARFTIQGTAGRMVNVTLPEAGQLTGDGTAMTLSNFTSDVPAEGLQLSGTGAGTVNVGAMLTINANQAAGAYLGTFDVTVSYQ